MYLSLIIAARRQLLHKTLAANQDLKIQEAKQSLDDLENRGPTVVAQQELKEFLKNTLPNIQTAEAEPSGPKRDMTEKESERIHQAFERAQKWLTLSTSKRADVLELLFAGEVDSAKTNLGRVRSTVERWDTNRRNWYYDNHVFVNPGAAATSAVGAELHVLPRFFDQGVEDMASTVVHEASHASSVQTKDYFYIDSGGFWALPVGVRLKTADYYKAAADPRITAEEVDMKLKAPETGTEDEVKLKRAAALAEYQATQIRNMANWIGGTIADVFQKRPVQSDNRSALDAFVGLSKLEGDGLAALRWENAVAISNSYLRAFKFLGAATEFSISDGTATIVSGEDLKIRVTGIGEPVANIAAMILRGFLSQVESWPAESAKYLADIADGLYAHWVKAKSDLLHFTPEHQVLVDSFAKGV